MVNCHFKTRFFVFFFSFANSKKKKVQKSVFERLTKPNVASSMPELDGSKKKTQ